MLFEFKKGNPERLEGEVLAYVYNLAKCKHKECKKLKYPFLSAIPTFERPTKFNRILDQLKPEEDIESELFIERPMDSEQKEENIFTFDGDIIFSGEVICSAFAYSPIIGTIEAYMTNYFTQKYKRLRITNNYLTATPEEFKKEMYEMTKDLLNSFNKKDVSKTKQIESRIKEFIKGSKFLPEVNNIIGLSQTNVRDKYCIIWAYIDKIIAMQNDEHAKVQEYQERINKLLQQTKKL